MATSVSPTNAPTISAPISVRTLPFRTSRFIIAGTTYSPNTGVGIVVIVESRTSSCPLIGTLCLLGTSSANFLCDHTASGPRGGDGDLGAGFWPGEWGEPSTP